MEPKYLLIPDSLPLEKVCLLGCGVSTGYGAAINTAKVEEGSTCAIWGLGGIGLAVAMGCKAQKAARIIGVDVNENKFEMAKVFGVTEFVNPKNLTKPVHEAIADLTNGGCDYTFECIGNVATMRNAFDSCRQGWGQCIIIGVPPAGEEMSVLPMDLLLGKVLKGTGFGGWKSRSSMPRLVKDYQEKRIILDEFVTFTRPLARINDGFELMNDGKAIRTVIDMF
ncbi:hypothetical protein HAZT_HAZT010449 [Hyalella azteca]|uniref:Alcohol dehydrogenase-like C-terminal domain-containing protein n=1 Tax=Hyalella azteca TaxID=294128 RepID=A0A6A0HCJ0_HYAAZ|nr:hypothetical protein HAZT_HAZT010449 [Hyalella azteca]